MLNELHEQILAECEKFEKGEAGKMTANALTVLLLKGIYLQIAPKYEIAGEESPAQIEHRKYWIAEFEEKTGLSFVEEPYNGIIIAKPNDRDSGPYCIWTDNICNRAGLATLMQAREYASSVDSEKKQKKQEEIQSVMDRR